MVRAAVIGAGGMGSQHARVLSLFSNVRLVATCDTDLSRAQATAFGRGAYPYCDVQELLTHETLDAVVVATPTRSHAQITSLALSRGCHVLVEKPIASTVEEADSMIKLAARARRVLAVGYVERFNPAVIAVKQHIAEIEPIVYVSAIRVGPLGSSSLRGGVTLDLAVHELDMFEHLTGSPIKRVVGRALRLAHDEDDLVSATVEAQDGTLGALHCDWLSPQKVRRLSILGRKGSFDVDYLTQTVLLRTVNRTVDIEVNRGEPLWKELAAFIRAVKGESQFSCQGEDGLSSLRAALTLTKGVS